MADDLENRGPQDRSKVNVNEQWEVRWWTSKFRCTEAELKAAVKAVGTGAAAVQAYLSKR